MICVQGNLLKLELIYFTYFSAIVPSKSCVFLSCRPFVVNTKFSTGFSVFSIVTNWYAETTTKSRHYHCPTARALTHHVFTHKGCVNIAWAPRCASTDVYGRFRELFKLPSYYQDMNMPIKFCSETYFFRLEDL